MNPKKNYFKSGSLLLVLAVLVLALFLSIETSPCQIVSSSVFSSADQTETRLYVIANTLLPIREEKFAKEVIKDHLKQNSPRGKAVYELRLYRTEVHYHFHIECDVIYCDETGALL